MTDVAMLYIKTFHGKRMYFCHCAAFQRCFAARRFLPERQNWF